VNRRLLIPLALLMLWAGCAKKPVAQAPPPPAPKQNIFALLDDPSGKNSAIVVSNTGGSQDIEQPNHAVRLERADVAPTPPYSIDPPTVRRLFGAALDSLPEPEVRFVMYFDEARDTLDAEAMAKIPVLLKAIQDRRSTDIRVTGHTDRVGLTADNYQLGLRRATTVKDVLVAQGVAESSLEVTSHGEMDQLKKTGPGVPERENRRVEVIVH
jgi:outer membrane protein OmpA-like peptidoglycan-associated protein